MGLTPISLVLLAAVTGAQDAPQDIPPNAPAGPFLRYHHADIDGRFMSHEGPGKGTSLSLGDDLDWNNHRQGIWELGYRNAGRNGAGNRRAYAELEVSWLWTDASRDATLAGDASFNNVPFPAGTPVRSRFQLQRIELTGGIGAMDAITGFKDPGPPLFDVGVDFEFGIEWIRFGLEDRASGIDTDEEFAYPTAGFGLFALLQPAESFRFEARTLVSADARGVLFAAASSRHYRVDASLAASLEIAHRAVLDAGFRFMVGDYPIDGDGLYFDDDEELRLRYSIAAPYLALTIGF